MVGYLIHPSSKWGWTWDFPSGPAVRILCFYHWGPRFNKILQAASHSQTNKQTKKDVCGRVNLKIIQWQRMVRKRIIAEKKTSVLGWWLLRISGTWRVIILTQFFSNFVYVWDFPQWKVSQGGKKKISFSSSSSHPSCFPKELVKISIIYLWNIKSEP